MMRSKPSTSMQKTYDDCYLICSTAVYFESQNNEAEALRSWRNALDQIYYHNAYRVPANYRPKSETEKALQDSLRAMELQCKERVDLLEALRDSRAESKDGKQPPTANGSLRGRTSGTKTSEESEEKERSGWIGQGTVPPVQYPDLSRPSPALPYRPAPKRPSYSSKKSSGVDVPRSQSLPQSHVDPPLPVVSPGLTVPQPRKTSRTPSPEKKGGMLRTLRAGGKERPSSGRMASGLRGYRPPAASTAATQAWSTIQRPTHEKPRQLSADVNGNGGPSTSAATWDPFTRTLVERPSSRDPASNDNSRASSNSIVRPPSPSDFQQSRGEDAHDDPARFRGHAFPYPEYPMLSPPGSTNAFSYSSEDLNALEPPNTPPAPPKVPEKPFAAVNQRPKSPARLPKLNADFLSYRREYPPAPPVNPLKVPSTSASRTAPFGDTPATSSIDPSISSPQRRAKPTVPRKAVNVAKASLERQKLDDGHNFSSGSGEENNSSGLDTAQRRRRQPEKIRKDVPVAESPPTPRSPTNGASDHASESPAWEDRVAHLLKNLPKGVDEAAAKQIFNEIVIQGDEVHWDDVAGLEIAKSALKETVVYPFLRPDLFMGLREPARGMLLFGPPGTGKTMLARAVATESKSTFFAISASSLTSKYLGESEKLVRALFSLAKALAPSIIFVDEIDSLLSARGGSSEHEATRRIKTEFLIQWSDLAKAAAGRETSEKEKERGDASRVLVLAATNLPWAIDEAARRRFVRRQYIPLPEDHVREKQLRTLLSHQKHGLTEKDLERLVVLTDGFSGSDITALAKDAAMGPLRSLGEKLLHMTMEEIRPILFEDFQASLVNIRPSVSKQGLKEFEDWAKEFGERGG
ncbi:hypothetical protein LTR04_001418 [Oleoguttula sp. CCFEE 6159]|nr:hypothetical protein LTR04_001418 [Oleoguttula sp. CCFEE 6159]